MTFVCDDHIEGFDRDIRIVDDGLWRIVIALEGGSVFLLLRQLFAGQRRIDALNGGDDDGRIGVNTGRPELLHTVKLGEQPPGSGRAIAGIFGGGLVAEIAPVDKKENSPHASVCKQAIGRRAGGEGLAGAHRHLNQRARIVARERALQSLDRFDLTGAQPFGHERRQMAQPRPQRVGLGQPAAQGFRAMERKDTA